MSPFSVLLHSLRTQYGLRQTELAERVGYEQSYISALEIGLKGPPTQEFIDRIAKAIPLSEAEKEKLRAAAQASQRKLVINPDAPTDIYWLLSDLRDEVHHLNAAQVRMIREVLALRCSMDEAIPSQQRLRRRRQQEAPM